MLTGAEIDDRLAGLSGALADGRHFWDTRPFRDRVVGWEAEHPELSAWTRSLTDEALWAAEAEPLDVPSAPPQWRAWGDRLRPLTALDPIPVQAAALTKAEAWHVKDRKQRQIAGLVAVCASTFVDAPAVVEWCAGRGSLGRAAGGALGRPVILLERDPELCRPPGGAAEAPGVRHVCCDVLDDPTPHIPTGAGIVGLHPCGALTDALLSAAVRAHADVVAAPCCLHRLAGATHHTPRSTVGAAAPFRLHADDLRVATREARHAGARRTRIRRRELIRRAGWDLLRREATGQDHHHGLPVMQRNLFDLPFAEFIHRMAAERGEPMSFVPEQAEAAARVRVREIRATELPRLLFRRAMELWVNLDRASALRESHAVVLVGTFCDAQATPRNIAIVASNPSGT